VTLVYPRTLTAIRRKWHALGIQCGDVLFDGDYLVDVDGYCRENDERLPPPLYTGATDVISGVSYGGSDKEHSRGHCVTAVSSKPYYLTPNIRYAILTAERAFSLFAAITRAFRCWYVIADICSSSVSSHA